MAMAVPKLSSFEEGRVPNTDKNKQYVSQVVSMARLLHGYQDKPSSQKGLLLSGCCAFPTVRLIKALSFFQKSKSFIFSPGHEFCLKFN